MKRRIRGRAPIARLGLLALVAACRGEARREVHPEADGAATSRPAFVAPSVTLVRVDTVRVTSPVGSDCNRPSWWVGDTLFQMVSNQHPWRSRGGRDAASAQPFEPMRFLDDDPRFRWDEGRQWYVHDINASDAPTPTYMRWMESVYRAPATGVLYGLYHMEEGPYVRCPAPYERPYLSVPHIGLGRSRDNGRTWENLGIIVSDGSFEISCDLPVRFFAGGVGDPSMAIGPDSNYAYIAFTDYSGDDPGRQGIQLARRPTSTSRWPRMARARRGAGTTAPGAAPDCRGCPGRVWGSAGRRPRWGRRPPSCPPPTPGCRRTAAATGGRRSRGTRTWAPSCSC
jgi:hypothetical protein